MCNSQSFIGKGGRRKGSGRDGERTRKVAARESSGQLEGRGARDEEEGGADDAHV